MASAWLSVGVSRASTPLLRGETCQLLCDVFPAFSFNNWKSILPEKLKAFFLPIVLSTHGLAAPGGISITAVIVVPISSATVVSLISIVVAATAGFTKHVVISVVSIFWSSILIGVLGIAPWSIMSVIRYIAASVAVPPAWEGAIVTVVAVVVPVFAVGAGVAPVFAAASARGR